MASYPSSLDSSHPPASASTGEKTSPRPKTTPSGTVIRYVRELHTSGKVAAGEPLPSERALSRTLGVHRATVRRGLNVLTEEGFLRLRENGERVIRNETVLGRQALQGLVSVVMPGLDHPEYLASHTQTGWMEMIGQAAIRALRETGRGVMILPPSDVTESFISQIRAVPPAGMIVTECPMDQTAVERIAGVATDLPFPIVAYGNHPRWAQVDRVVSDHAHGCRELCEFLWGRGARRLMLVMPEPNDDQNFWMDRRIAGYEDWIRDNNVDYRCLVRIPPPTPKITDTYTPEGFEIMTRYFVGLLAEHLIGPEAADAILLPSDGSVPIVAAVCRKLKRTPGRDIEIVGYDNYWQDLKEMLLDPYRPPATVDKLNLSVGAEQVRLLENRIAGRLANKPEVRLISPKLIITD